MTLSFENKLKEFPKIWNSGEGKSRRSKSDRLINKHIYLALAEFVTDPIAYFTLGEGGLGLRIIPNGFDDLPEEVGSIFIDLEPVVREVLEDEPYSAPELADYFDRLSAILRGSDVAPHGDSAGDARD